MLKLRDIMSTDIVTANDKLANIVTTSDIARALADGRT